MKRFLPFILLFIPFITTCNFGVESYDPNQLRQNHWDLRCIPDDRNCGVEPGKTLTVAGESDVEVAPGVKIFFRRDNNSQPLEYEILLRSNLPEYILIKNYDFSSLPMVTLGMGNYEGVRYVAFENCKFKSFRNDSLAPGSKGKVQFYFDHCSFIGAVRSSYIHLYNCKIGGFTGDAMNPLRDFTAQNVYVYDLFTEAKEGEVHIDGVQIYGDPNSRNNESNGKWITKVETGDIHLNNIRFEIPGKYLGPNCKVGGNSCIFFDPEFSDISNVSFDYLYLNGAGQWYPLRITKGKNNERSANGISWVHEKISASNVMVSKNYGKILNDDLIPQAKVSNIEHHDSLFVTSVWKDESGTVHLLVTNDTPEDKTLIIKSDSGQVSYSIPHCPSVSVLMDDPRGRINPDEPTVDKKGKAYKDYAFEELPFNKEYKISGNPAFIVCYQDDQQIRYVSFDGKKHYLSEIKN